MRKLNQAIAIALIVSSSILAVLAVYILYIRPMIYQNYYLDVMNNCADPSKRVIVRSWFIEAYNFTEIYNWLHENLELVILNENFPPEQRYTDPIEIKEFGKGRCEEFSILYVAACLAHGYECRLVVATDCSGLVWTSKHAWAEVKISGQWVHVDPSERRWNEPQMYRHRSWGENIGSKFRIFAFEEGDKVKEVTQNYV